MKKMISKDKFYTLYNKNSPKNPNREHGPIDAKLLLRDLSLHISYFFAQKKMSANFVTFLFLIAGLAGNGAILILGFEWLIIAFVLHEIAQILDCVDGTLSRYYGTFSKYGENFDTLASVIISGTFMLAFGHRLYSETGQEIYLLLAGIGAFSKAFEHQLIITKDTLLDNELIKKMFKRIQITRFLAYGIESIITEIRLFVFLIIVLSIVEKITGLDLLGIVYGLYILIAVFENLFYKIFVAAKQLQIIEINQWKGWDKQ